MRRYYASADNADGILKASNFYHWTTTQTIRHFALGRGYWLYSSSPCGAHATAFMYSLVESAKANKLEPKADVQVLFERRPHATTTEERRQFLPMCFKNV